MREREEGEVVLNNQGSSRQRKASGKNGASRARRSTPSPPNGSLVRNAPVRRSQGTASSSISVTSRGVYRASDGELDDDGEDCLDLVAEACEATCHGSGRVLCLLLCLFCIVALIAVQGSTRTSRYSTGGAQVSSGRSSKEARAARQAKAQAIPECVLKGMATRPPSRLQPLFPDIRLVDERVHQAVYRILRQTQKAFAELDIQYWADGGTLLGAMRHGGVVPWDDDVDICIEQANLAKLEELTALLERRNLTISTTFYGFKVHPLNYTHPGFPPFVDVFPVKFITLSSARAEATGLIAPPPMVAADGRISPVRQTIMAQGAHARHLWPVRTETFYETELFPLQTYKFGNGIIHGAAMPYPYLDRKFGCGWRTHAKIHFPHQANCSVTQLHVKGHNQGLMDLAPAQLVGGPDDPDIPDTVFRLEDIPYRGVHHANLSSPDFLDMELFLRLNASRTKEGMLKLDAIDDSIFFEDKERAAQAHRRIVEEAGHPLPRVPFDEFQPCRSMDGEVRTYSSLVDHRVKRPVRRSSTTPDSAPLLLTLFNISNIADGDDGTYFWSATPPRHNDYVAVAFPSAASPCPKVRVFLGTMHEPLQDQLESGVVEVLVEPADALRVDRGWELVGRVPVREGPQHFTLDVPQAVVNRVYGVRVRCTQAQDEWVMVRALECVNA